MQTNEWLEDFASSASKAASGNAKGYFGVRRQSEAATPLWVLVRLSSEVLNPKRCRATLATALQNNKSEEIQSLRSA